MTIYSIKEYASNFPQQGKLVSEMTIRRMIDANQLPSNHIVSRHGLQFVIEVHPKAGKDIADRIEKACIKAHEYMSKFPANTHRTIPTEVVANIALEFDLKFDYLNRILNGK